MGTAPGNLATWIAAEARRAGRSDAPAVRQGDRVWTHAQLAEQAARVGSALRDVGVVPGERVAVLMRDTLEAAASILGVMHAGAVAVPLSELATPTDLGEFLLHAACAAAIVEASLDPVLDEIRGTVPSLRVVLCAGPGSPGGRDFHALVAAATPGAAVEVDPEAPCLLLYSAGSGPDELRAVPHGAAAAIAAAGSCRTALALGPEDRVLSTVRLSTAFGLGAGLLFPLAAGAEVVLFPEQPRSEVMFAALERHQPTVVCATPSVYAQLARDAEAAGRAQPLAGVRLAVAGAEGLPEQLAARARTVLGCELFAGYGLTETFQFALGIATSDPAWQPRTGLCGHPLPGIEARVVDEAGQPTPVDEIGTLQLRAPSLLRTYWGDSRPAHGDDGWFATRDRFLVDAAGLYHHCGRTDDLFKVGGKWVSPAEIERALVAHEAVWECAVIGADDEDGFAKPLAMVVTNVGHPAGAELEAELRAYVKQTLAPYKYPRWIEFVDELPRGPGGKVLRYKLRPTRRRRRAETGHGV